MDRLSRAAALVAAAGPWGCRGEEAREPVCGLHSASAPVILESGDGKPVLAVGAQLLPADRIRATGWALLECHTGSLRVLSDERVRWARSPRRWPR